MTLPEIRAAIATVLDHVRDVQASDAQMQAALQCSASRAYDGFERVTAHGALIAIETARGIVSPLGDMRAVQIGLDALNVCARTIIQTRDDFAAQYGQTMTILLRRHAELIELQAAAVFAAGVTNQLKAPDGNE